MRATRMLTASALALALAAPAALAQTEQAALGEEIDITTWAQADLYDGFTAEQLMDTDVYGPTGDEIGEVENLLIGRDGAIRRLIIESGGFLDIGDTHFAVPWQDAEVSQDFERVVVPVTEENLDTYTVFPEDEDETGAARAFRATELIGDYVRLEENIDYGLVQDLVFGQDGTLKAVVVYPDVGYGIYGPYAYPYYGYEYGFDPGLDYYGLPYGREEVGELEPFDYETFGVAEGDVLEDEGELEDEEEIGG